MSRNRCCCNCGHCIRKNKGTYVQCVCELDDHYIGYVQVFEGWCKHWAKDHTFDESEVE